MEVVLEDNAQEPCWLELTQQELCVYSFPKKARVYRRLGLGVPFPVVDLTQSGLIVDGVSFLGPSDKAEDWAQAINRVVRVNAGMPPDRQSQNEAPPKPNTTQRQERAGAQPAKHSAQDKEVLQQVALQVRIAEFDSVVTPVLAVEFETKRDAEVHHVEIQWYRLAPSSSAQHLASSLLHPSPAPTPRIAGDSRSSGRPIAGATHPIHLPNADDFHSVLEAVLTPVDAAGKQVGAVGRARETIGIDPALLSAVEQIVEWGEGNFEVVLDLDKHQCQLTIGREAVVISHQGEELAKESVGRCMRVVLQTRNPLCFDLHGEGLVYRLIASSPRERDVIALCVRHFVYERTSKGIL